MVDDNSIIGLRQKPSQLSRFWRRYCLYNPIKLYAVNKAVEFVPYLSGLLKLDGVSVTAQHWSVRKQKEGVQE